MEALQAHFQEQWRAYLGVLICGLPLLYIFRKRIVPVILWILEIIVYMAGVHMCLAGLIRLIRWFKLESTMYIQERVDPGWQIPLNEFWNRELYKPFWIFYFEVVLLLGVVVLVFFYRPLHVQKRMSRRDPVTKGRPARIKARAKARAKK